MTPPRWLELLVRMTAGEPEEQPFVGILEVRDLRRGEDGEPVEAVGDDLRWPSAVRVLKDRERYRVEALDGTVLTIRTARHTFVFGQDDEDLDEAEPAPRRFDNEHDDEVRPGAHGHVIERREVGDWRGDDFTTPIGPPVPVTYLGRDAWEVELAPPPHKPSSLILTIDPVTGMTYQQRSERYGVLSRWVELTDVDSHPDSLFEWDGHAHWYEASYREVTDEEIQQWERERAEQAEAVGLGALRLAVAVDVHVHEAEEDGSVFASLRAEAHGVVARRPRSDDPWEPDADYPFTEQWTDSTWDWYVGSDSSADHLTQVRRQLAEPRPDEG